MSFVHKSIKHAEKEIREGVDILQNAVRQKKRMFYSNLRSKSRMSEILSVQTSVSYVRSELGIVHPYKFLSLRRSRRLTGMRFAFGKWRGTSCIFEFNVDSEDWNRKHTATTLKWRTKVDRPCYFVRDFIYIRELQWKHIPGATENESDMPALLKLVLLLLEQGKPKEYVHGYQILKLKLNGDGTGTAKLQPGVLVEDLFFPMGKQRVASESELSAWHLSRDSMAPLKTLMKVNLMVADAGATLLSGGVKKAVGTGISLVAKRRLRQLLLKRLEKAALDAGLAFAKSLTKSWLRSLSDLFLSTDPVIVASTVRDSSKVRNALIKATTAALNSMLSTAFGEVGSHIFGEKAIKMTAKVFVEHALDSCGGLFIKLVSIGLYSDAEATKIEKELSSSKPAIDLMLGLVKTASKQLLDGF